jgi:sortase (surface protein transpeptidase)
MAADGTVLASTTVTLNEGTSTVLYLVGSSDGGTLDLMAQRFDDLATPPGDVLTGSGGLGADPSSPRWVPLAALMSVVIAAALVLVRRSHRRTALPVAAAFATIVALSPAALGGSRAATDVGAVPAAGVAAAAAPVRVVDVGAARAAPSPAIAVHSGRLADLTSFGQRAAPTRVRIPALGVSGAIVPVGVEAGTNDVAIPTDVRTIGWYRFGARPGDAGSAVLVGHVASADQGAGLFYRLRDLAPGARIEVTFGDGSTRSFVVRARREYAKNDLPRDVFARSGASRLVLVTCGGPYDASTGHYRDNIVVYAVPVAGT